MLRSRLESSLLMGRHGPRLSPPDGEGGGTGAQDPPKPDANTGSGQGNQGGEGGGAVTFTPEQQREIDRRIGVARREGRTAAENAATEAQREADRQRQIDADAAKGEFETARKAIEADRDAARGDRDRLQAENGRLRDAIQAGLTAGWDALPEEVRTVGAELYPEDDPLGRWEYLHKPSTQALVAKLTGSQGGRQRGNGPDPRPSGAASEIPTVKGLADEMRAARGLRV